MYRKTDIPDMYNELPFPDGYFDSPESRSSEGNGGYNMSMAVDYADLEKKDVKKCSAEEMAMFHTLPKVGGLVNPRLFARYLEEAYSSGKGEEHKDKVRMYSLRYVHQLPFTRQYLDRILPAWTEGETSYDFIVAEFLQNKLNIDIDDFSNEQMQVLRNDSTGKPIHLKDKLELVQGGWKHFLRDA